MKKVGKCPMKLYPNHSSIMNVITPILNIINPWN